MDINYLVFQLHQTDPTSETYTSKKLFHSCHSCQSPVCLSITKLDRKWDFCLGTQNKRKVFGKWYFSLKSFILNTDGSRSFYVALQVNGNTHMCIKSGIISVKYCQALVAHYCTIVKLLYFNACRHRVFFSHKAQADYSLLVLDRYKLGYLAYLGISSCIKFVDGL